MATLASTQVTGGALGLPVPVGGLHLEVWRVAGGSVDDTATIAPARGRLIFGAWAGNAASTTLSTAGATNVVFTLLASAATSVTFDAFILVAE